ncbi:hypothetical protein EDF64_10320 [Curtobacterium flaccumfaciens]|uniref:Uncharacterized protein n=1 Tax=Curtobacterium flaccumfaciens TaxID=2035 RepID=A0A4R6DK55_9MICO|nr:hypothetical protein [Curtobacterium flaccumfaciens]TDN45100.1 hypothetical protein EDF64_10320 [Curtobacterium flaccumfaciens]
MAQRGPSRPTARIEEALGFVGMFGVLFLGVTVFCEVTGRPALGWALTLLVCVLGVVALDRWRVAVLRRTASADGVGGVPAAPVRRAGAGAPAGAGAAAGAATGAGAAAAPSRRAATAPSVDGRVHRHVGWDELAPAGRRQVHTTRPTPAPAQTGAVGDVTRPSDG